MVPGLSSGAGGQDIRLCAAPRRRLDRVERRHAVADQLFHLPAPISGVSAGAPAGRAADPVYQAGGPRHAAAAAGRPVRRLALRFRPVRAAPVRRAVRYPDNRLHLPVLHLARDEGAQPDLPDPDAADDYGVHLVHIGFPERIPVERDAVDGRRPGSDLHPAGADHGPAVLPQLRADRPPDAPLRRGVMGTGGGAGGHDPGGLHRSPDGQLGAALVRLRRHRGLSSRQRQCDPGKAGRSGGLHRRLLRPAGRRGGAQPAGAQRGSRQCADPQSFPCRGGGLLRYLRHRDRRTVQDAAGGKGTSAPPQQRTLRARGPRRQRRVVRLGSGQRHGLLFAPHG